MKRRVICRGLSVGCLCAAVFPLTALLGGGTASALAPTATGYWDKVGGAVPTVPSGGLFVANDPTTAVNPSSPPPVPLPVPLPSPPPLPVSPPTGPTAISAVRVTGVDPSKDATLSLTVATGWIAPSPSVLTIVACPIAGSWSPPSGGAGSIAKAPSYDCTSASTGRVAGDLMSISWLLPSSFQATPGEYDIALVPNPAGLPVVDAVAFAKPDAQSVHATIGSAVPPAVTTPPPASPVATPAAPTGGDLSATTPLTDTPALPVSGTPPPVPAGRITVRTPGRAGLVGLSLPGTSRAHRLMAVLVLIVMAGAWWWVGGQPVPSPRLLGALAGDGRTNPSGGTGGTGSVGGVGRFSRPRSRQANRL